MVKNCVNQINFGQFRNKIYCCKGRFSSCRWMAINAAFTTKTTI